MIVVEEILRYLLKILNNISGFHTAIKWHNTTPEVQPHRNLLRARAHECKGFRSM